MPLKIDKYNWIQIIEGNLLLKSKDSNSNIFLESGDALGFEVNYYDDVSIDTEKELDFLLFSMPSLKFICYFYPSTSLLNAFKACKAILR